MRHKTIFAGSGLYFLNARVCIFRIKEFLFSECKSSYFLDARVRIFWMQDFVFSECNSLYFPNAFQPILLILRIPRPYLESCERVHYNSLLASFNNRGTEGTLAESDSNSREQNRLSVSRPKEIICCQIHKNICCLISANTLKCIISHRFIYPEICAQKFEM